jgi:hypothetical protein
MPWQFGILGVAAAAAGMGGVMADGSPAMIILVPIGSTVAMTLGAVQLMKLANRRAQRRIAAGEFPDLKALPSRAAKQDGKDGGAGCPA